MRYKNPKLIKFVKTLPCFMCGAPADDAHHLVGVGNMGGMGMTAPDWATMPMCRGCHTMLHNTPEVWNLQWEAITRTLGMAIEEGVEL